MGEEYDSLVTLIRGSRPWSKEPDVAALLREWAAGNFELTECLDVAAKLARIGREPNQGAWPDTLVASLTYLMLRTVQQGGSPWDFDSLADAPNLPDRTRRRHREEGMAYCYQRRRRDLALRDLMLGGRSESAARKWLQRNPGIEAHEAPPPRPRSRVGQ